MPFIFIASPQVLCYLGLGLAAAAGAIYAAGKAAAETEKA